MRTNPIAVQLYHALPRSLSFFNRDRHSPGYGIGDRQHVSWCTKDYANGTHQGLAHGLARLLRAGCLPDWCPELCVRDVIESAFIGLPKITRTNGSLEEAFPHEHSFCVTALALHDLLWAQHLCPARSAEEDRQRVDAMTPLAYYLHKADEHHGLISNHLATAAGALLLWHERYGDPRAEARGTLFLERIFANADSEGWFREYDGADPGYQSLCMHYLALLHSLRPDLGLLPRLKAALEFLGYFILPDGSFGGVIGSRRTGFYYPTAAALLAAEVPLAARMHTVMTHSINTQACVTLSAMDDDNFAPMFNAYAAAISAPAPETLHPLPLPYENTTWERHVFPSAGIAIFNTHEHYTVLSTRLRGAYESASRITGAHHTDGGSLIMQGDSLWSTQNDDPQKVVVLEKSSVTITGRAAKILRRSPTPTQMLCLRLLALTVMRIPLVSRCIKKLLVHLLMGEKSYYPATIRRSISMAGPLPATTAEMSPPAGDGTLFLPDGGNHTSIHMASAGYWKSTEECR